MKRALLLFLLLIGFGMWIYPGGTVLDPRAPHFLFWQNFLSDLGRTRTFAGEANIGPRLCFVPAILLIALASGRFFQQLLPRLLLSSQGRFRRVFQGTLATTVAARCALAITPWDIWGVLHLFFVQLTFFSGLMLGWLLILESRQSASLLRGERWPLRIWVMLQAIYLLLLLCGPFLPITSLLMLYVAAGSQKILLLGECWVYLRLQRTAGRF